ncbi:condensin II non structural maintenance of chromosomes subunit domain-containing protein [Ditylenchus destructor]|nr:condensin II non structural maintenance of chromosomes subunit domain-containing protein [Ditylenchus destructor]
MVAPKKDAVPQISLALTGYSTDNAEEFIQKAFVTDKGQKQIIKKLYQDRDEIAANCPPELALQAVQTQSFLACVEGRKLAAHFLIEILECELFWNTVKTQIQTAKASKVMCQYWGAVILYAWKAAEMNPLEDDAIRKKDVEALIVQDLFYCTVFMPKTYAHKFNWLLWRNLDAPNENIRIAVSHMLLKFYPLKAVDEFVDADYMQKQNDAMLRMLMDPCLPIRVEAAKKIPFHLGLHWKDFPRNLIKDYLDTLSLDNAADVRAAVYEGMEGLLRCSPALNATQHALGILAKRGINDKTEKVRLAAFRLLNKLKGHRFIKYFDLVEMDDLLMRLDFEHSNSVQQEIVLLIFKSFCPKTIEGIDFAERYKRIRFMCKKSRNASLHFHRWIYRLKLVTVEQAGN